MALPTTTIGSYPKPYYVPVRDWFQLTDGMTSSLVTERYASDLAEAGPEAEALFRRATEEALADQIACGIEVPTDGEMRRENYVHYHCRHMQGFDFKNLSNRNLRDGAYNTDLPTIRGRILPGDERFLVHDYACAAAASDRPVKITLPGPLTIADTTADAFYGDAEALGSDLADALNREIRALAEAGCQYIQIDEPLFARYPDKALRYGIAQLESCFSGLPPAVTRVAHVCCGYPNHLDQTDYKKADPGAYLQLAEALNRAKFDQVSIEDAHRHNDLTLLSAFDRKTVILGVIAIAKSRVETADEISRRIEAALGYIDRDHLWLAPDCGLGFLTRDLAMRKLRAMTEAAARF